MRVSRPPALPAPSLDWREERAASGDKLPARVAPSLPPSPSATDSGTGAVLFPSLHLLLARLSYRLFTPSCLLTPSCPSSGLLSHTSAILSVILVWVFVVLLSLWAVRGEGGWGWGA